jgi:hypothetical protein
LSALAARRATADANAVVLRTPRRGRKDFIGVKLLTWRRARRGKTRKGAPGRRASVKRRACVIPRVWLALQKAVLEFDPAHENSPVIVASFLHQ